MSTKLALVTGATKGIGRQIVEALAREGFSLALVARSEGNLNEVRLALSEVYPNQNFSVMPCDLSDSKQRNSLCQTLVQEEKPWSVLVNNAGVYLPSPLLDEPLIAWQTMWAVNVEAPYALIRALVPGMQLRNRGHVFNICSVTARAPQRGSATYSATKAALYSLSNSLRQETLGTGVVVTSIMPGQTWSNSWTGVELPQNRLMQPQDIGQALVDAWKLAPSAVVEEIWLRPAEGDLSN